MSQYPSPHPDPDSAPQDLALLHFLQQYRTTPPPPASELEDRIMTLIEQDAVLRPARGGSGVYWTQVCDWIRQFWIPSLMVASLAVVGTGYYALRPDPTLTTAELEELESFLESTWLGVVEDPLDTPIDFFKL